MPGTKRYRAPYPRGGAARVGAARGHGAREIVHAETLCTRLCPPYSRCISSNRKRLVRRGMKHLLRSHQPGRQSFGTVMPQERLQHLAIGCEAVGPEVVPHQLARGLELLVDEGQRAFAG